MDSPPLRLQLANDLSGLEPARLALLGYLLPHRPSARAVYAVELVLEEILSNQIKYAFNASDPSNAQPEPLIEFSAWTQAGTIMLKFVDSGVAFDPLQAEAPVAPTSIDAAPVGGLGVVLVRKFASSASYQRRDGRNCLTIGVALA